MAWFVRLSVVLLLLTLTDALLCEFYDRNLCEGQEPSAACPVEKECDSYGVGGHVGCMAVWHNNSASDGYKVSVKGCWPYQEMHSNCKREKCVGDGGSKQPFFCCCVGTLCNREVSVAPAVLTTAPPQQTSTSTVAIRSAEPMRAVLLAFLPICLVALLIFFSYWCYRRMRYKRCTKEKQPETGDDSMGRVDETLPQTPFTALQFLAVEARGRYGEVFKAQLCDRLVAVKIFPLNEIDSWKQEQAIYQVAGLRHHPNILAFLGADERTDVQSSYLQTDMPKYILVTEFQSNGCLTKYLKANELTLNIALNIAKGMLCGLSFLHDGDKPLKPTIVHRDLKSQNVLLGADLTARISDFGLAMKCAHGRTPSDTHSQVGTRRYMAPEVLEGAAEFSAVAFRQIDVYAAALVLWEIFSRTRVHDESTVCEHRLPFEEEVGAQPSLQCMQETVVEKRKRPVMPASLQRQADDVLWRTLGEMWDAEPEARITAGCAHARLQTFSCGAPQPSVHASVGTGERAPLIVPPPLGDTSSTLNC